MQLLAIIKNENSPFKTCTSYTHIWDLTQNFVFCKFIKKQLFLFSAGLEKKFDNHFVSDRNSE